MMKKIPIINHKKDSFTIEDCVEEFNSPISLFNLDKNTFLQYLEEIKRHNLITVNKTAGLNTIYIQKRLNIKELKIIIKEFLLI